MVIDKEWWDGMDRIRFWFGCSCLVLGTIIGVVSSTLVELGWLNTLLGILAGALLVVGWMTTDYY